MTIVTLELLVKETEESCWLAGTSRKTIDTEKFHTMVTVDVQISICRLTGRPVKRHEEKYAREVQDNWEKLHIHQF